MPINPLNHHYAMENPASVYDEEALTALELAGRTAAKVNEVVKAQNQLQQDTDAHLSQQDQSIKKMNDETMPAKVKAEVKRNIESGAFSEEINRYAGDLEARVDNLLGSVDEGSTTMDAEVIDLRVGNDRHTYESAGKATRKSIAQVGAKMARTTALQSASNEVATWESIPIVKTPAYILGNDGYPLEMASGDQAYSISQYIPVTGGDVLYISALNFSGQAIYSFFNEHKEVVSFYSANGEPEILTRHRCEVPAGVCYVVITNNSWYQPTPEFLKATRINTADIKLRQYVTNTNAYTRQQFTLGEAVELTYERDYMLEQDGTLIQDGNLNASYFTTSLIPIEPGKIYKVKCCAWYEKLSYALYDAFGTMVHGELCNGQEMIVTEEFIQVPLNVAFIRLAYNKHFLSGAELVEAVGPNIEAINPLIGAQWVAIGDSITEKNYRADTNYLDYVSTELGVTVHNHGISGSGFFSGQKYVDRISSLPETFDVLTVMGSGNDLGDLPMGTADDTGTTTLGGCMNHFFDALKQARPFAKVGVMTSIPWKDQTPANGNCLMAQYNEMLTTIARRRGFPVLDLFHESNLDPNDEGFRVEFYNENGEQDAGVHPNSKGHKRFYPVVREFIRKLI